MPTLESFARDGDAETANDVGGTARAKTRDIEPWTSVEAMC